MCRADSPRSLRRAVPASSNSLTSRTSPRSCAGKQGNRDSEAIEDLISKDLSSEVETTQRLPAPERLTSPSGVTMSASPSAAPSTSPSASVSSERATSFTTVRGPAELIPALQNEQTHSNSLPVAALMMTPDAARRKRVLKRPRRILSDLPRRRAKSVFEARI